MHFKLRLIPAATAACLLVACGGGSNSTSPPSYTPTSGIAVDGYLKFAKVVCDTNDNGLADTGEPTAYTLGGVADSGKFTFPQGCSNSSLLVSGGTNADTGLLFVGLLKAPAGATVVSPLTTMVSAGMTQTQLKTALGLPAGTDLLNTDPVTNATLFRTTLAVQQLLQKTTELFAGLAGVTGSAALEPIYTQVAAAFAATLSSGSPLLTSATEMDETVVNALIQAAAQSLIDSGTASPLVKEALADIGASALADVVATSLTFQAEKLLTATDVNLVEETKTTQGSTYITDYVKSIEQKLAGNPTPEEIAALGETLLADVTEGTTSINPGASGTVLVSFDEDPPAFTGMGAYGGALPEVLAGPTGSNGKVLKILKPTGAMADGVVVPWGGVYFGTATIPFTETRKKISAKVYSTRADAVIKFKVEVPGGTSVEIASSPTGPANTWSTVIWDFSAVDTTKAYTVIAITPDAETVTSGQSYYIDDITLVGAITGPVVATDYLAVADNAISLFNGASTVAYSMTQFQSSPGISVKWPMSSSAALNVTLTQVGNFSLAAGQKLSAAVQITETTATGKGEVKAYIENVSISKSGNFITIAVPSPASAKVYGVSGDGLKKAVIDFATGVANVSNTLTTSGLNSILLGDVINYTINNVSNDFTGITALRGTYKVSIVVSDLPLRKADGSMFTPLTIDVPTTLGSSGAITASKPVTGWGLEGFITLTN